MDELTEAVYGEHRTTQETVTDGLREAILSGELKSGQPLRQVRIAERFGVSSVPVREALRQLEGEGLVTFYPRRGAVVSEISRNDIVEICEMCEILELLAFERSFPNLTPRDLSDAERILDMVDEREDEELLTSWGEINWRFHSILYRRSGRPRLLDTIESLHISFGRYIRIYLPAMDYREDRQEQHRAILNLCKSENREGAIEALRDHLQLVSASYLNFVWEHEPDGL